MFDVQLADEFLDRIRAVDGRYHERAYVFVLAALEQCQQQRTARGHISGQELAEACRDLALVQFGLTSRTVLEHWGIGTTDDIGRVVYVLIEVGLLIRHPDDRIDRCRPNGDGVENNRNRRSSPCWAMVQPPEPDRRSARADCLSLGREGVVWRKTCSGRGVSSVRRVC